MQYNNQTLVRFQLVIQEAKAKLDLAIRPGTWLMPSRMIINTATMNQTELIHP